LYQDKEDRMKVNTNEGEAYKDSVLELLDIYRDDRQGYHDDGRKLSYEDILSNHETSTISPLRNDFNLRVGEILGIKS
jgi:hypothetical protein